jgi:Translation initiation factor IF-2, N-terminal region
MKSPDHTKRGYLLLKGCKNLVDVINFKGEVFVSETTTVGELAALLGQKPPSIITHLKQLGVFATVKQVVGFETVRTVARKYGYAAKLLDLKTMRKIALNYGYAPKRSA